MGQDAINSGFVFLIRRLLKLGSGIIIISYLFILNLSGQTKLGLAALTVAVKYMGKLICSHHEQTTLILRKGDSLTYSPDWLPEITVKIHN